MAPPPNATFDRNGRPIPKGGAGISNAVATNGPEEIHTSVVIGYERGETENNTRLQFSVKAPNGTSIEGFESYVQQQSNANFRGSGFSLDTDGDGVADLEFDSYNGYNTTAISTLDPATGEMRFVDEFKTSEIAMLGDNKLSDGGTLAVSQRMFDLVHAAHEDGATAGELRALQDFAAEGMNSLGLATPTQSQVYAVGDAFRNEETGRLVEGRGEIAVDFDGNGTKETRVIARLSENGSTSLIVNSGDQRIAVNDSTLARNIIGDIADARANGSYSDTEKANLMDLARSALQVAGLGNMTGSMQVAQADRGTLGDVGMQSVGSVQQGPTSAIAI